MGNVNVLKAGVRAGIASSSSCSSSSISTSPSSAVAAAASASASTAAAACHTRLAHIPCINTYHNDESLVFYLLICSLLLFSSLPRLCLLHLSAGFCVPLPVLHFTRISMSGPFLMGGEGGSSPRGVAADVAYVFGWHGVVVGETFGWGGMGYSIHWV